MGPKILWIAVCTTMAFWLGCAGHGDEQNYKVLDEDRPMLQPDRGDDKPGAQTTPIETTKEAATEPPPGSDPNKPMATAPLESQPGVEPVSSAKVVKGPETASAGEDEINLTTPSTGPAAAPVPGVLDRTGWPRLAVSTEPGVTHHRPQYFEDYGKRRETRRISRAEDETYRLGDAYKGADAENYDLRNIGALFIDPLLYAGHLIALPVEAVIKPPWSDETTPDASAVKQ